MRKLIIGIIIGLLIGTTGSVLASEGGSVTAVYQKFNYIVNGQPVDVEADALVVEGRSHLPTRALADLLGYDVNFIDGEIGTIVLTSKQPQSETAEDKNTKKGVEDQMINTGIEWISLRELALQGIEVSVGPELNVLTIKNPAGTKIQFMTTDIIEGETAEINLLDGGSITVKSEGGFTFLDAEQLRQLNLMD